MTDVISHENAVVDLDAAQPQPGMASDELVRQLAERARAEGLRLLDWLVAEQTAPRGHFSFTPTHGWTGGEPRPAFDQQPIEAGAMADAAARAFTVTGQADWADVAIRSAGWFTGRNDLGVAMFDDRTPGVASTGCRSMGPTPTRAPSRPLCSSRRCDEPMRWLSRATGPASHDLRRPARAVAGWPGRDVRAPSRQSDHHRR